MHLSFLTRKGGNTSMKSNKIERIDVSANQLFFDASILLILQMSWYSLGKPSIKCIVSDLKKL